MDFIHVSTVQTSIKIAFFFIYWREKILTLTWTETPRTQNDPISILSQVEVLSFSLAFYGYVQLAGLLTVKETTKLQHLRVWRILPSYPEEMSKCSS